MKTGTKILILDDSTDLLDALEMFLEMHHFDVCTVTSDNLFKTQLKRYNPDIIILDVYIKGYSNGIEICKAIKCAEDTKHIPVILMSASIKAVKNYEDCHADAIIEKPFDLSEFLKKIRPLIKENTEKITSSKRTRITSLIPWPTGIRGEKHRNVQH